MRILSITAQKPNSTGSGVYLTELVKAFEKEGNEQAVLAGVYEEDEVVLPEAVCFYPVYFKTPGLPFPIAGMSDEMPYESTVYGQMTEEMVAQFKSAFRDVIRHAADEFKPDIIVCHHLYLVTALAREMLPDHTVCGFCHNTDLRQLKKISLERDFIKEQICRLDAIFALHEEQKKEILSLFPVEEERVTVAGTGYNSEVFCIQENVKEEIRKEDERQGKCPVRLIFAGKISEKKGVASLIRSFAYLPWDSDEMEVYLAGGAGNQDEYRRIFEMAERSKYPIYFPGKLDQTDLAKEYNKSDIFVLPSFSEGLPLTVMEAMACGNKVIVTDLPGIKPWIEANVKNAPVVYVTPPKMVNTDEPVEESLKIFEKELADAIVRCKQMPGSGYPDLGRVSWHSICEFVYSISEKERLKR